MTQPAAGALVADVRRPLRALGAWLAPQGPTLGVAATLGLLAVELPAHFHGPLPPVRSPLFQWLGQGWQYCDCRTTWTLLFGSGLLLGLLWPPRWLIAGLSTMLVFPIAASVEMLAFPLSQSHSLWPIEFALYLAFSLCAVAGSSLARAFLFVVHRIRAIRLSLP